MGRYGIDVELKPWLTYLHSHIANHLCPLSWMNQTRGLEEHLSGSSGRYLGSAHSRFMRRRLINQGVASIGGTIVGFYIGDVQMQTIGLLREELKSRSCGFGRCMLGLLLVGVFWLAWDWPQVRANTLSQTGSDEACLMCHADPDFVGSFQNDELVSLYVDRYKYEHSVHGPAGLKCTACHTDLVRYPHHDDQQLCSACHPEKGAESGTEYTPLRVKLPFADRREMVLSINESCRSCHAHEFEVAVDSAHLRVLEGGNRDAPVCVDCHGGHEIVRLRSQPRDKVAHMCATCHKAVYSTYRTSVHGAALEAESNPDVPTCVECHGVHSIRGPRDSPYRNDSLAICGDCHANEALMQKYGISTDVFNTYLDDFHGRTVNLFRRQSDAAESHKAVCFDCHGIHNIRRPSDSLSTVYPTNLQRTCQQCHEDASIRFPSAWLSHYLPTWEHTPVLVIVKWAYQILIPVVIGGMLVYIALDINRRRLDKRRAKKRLRALAEKELEGYEFVDEITH